MSQNTGLYAGAAPRSGVTVFFGFVFIISLTIMAASLLPSREPGQAMDDAERILALDGARSEVVGPYLIQPLPDEGNVLVSKGTGVSIEGVAVLRRCQGIFLCDRYSGGEWIEKGPWEKNLPRLLHERRTDLEKKKAEADAKALDQARAAAAAASR